MKKNTSYNNGHKYILFRIGIYFREYPLAVEMDILIEILFLKKKDKSIRKKLGCKFIRINTSNAKNGYGLDYESGNIEAFIDEFKNKKIKEEKEIREKLKMRNEK